MSETKKWKLRFVSCFFNMVFSCHQQQHPGIYSVREYSMQQYTGTVCTQKCAMTKEQRTAREEISSILLLYLYALKRMFLPIRFGSSGKREQSRACQSITGFSKLLLFFTRSSSRLSSLLQTTTSRLSTLQQYCSRERSVYQLLLRCSLVVITVGMQFVI